MLFQQSFMILLFQILPGATECYFSMMKYSWHITLICYPFHFCTSPTCLLPCSLYYVCHTYNTSYINSCPFLFSFFFEGTSNIDVMISWLSWCHCWDQYKLHQTWRTGTKERPYGSIFISLICSIHISRKICSIFPWNK